MPGRQQNRNQNPGFDENMASDITAMMANQAASEQRAADMRNFNAPRNRQDANTAQQRPGPESPMENPYAGAATEYGASSRNAGTPMAPEASVYGGNPQGHDNGPITESVVSDAAQRCADYWEQMQGLTDRLIENENYYRQQYMNRMKVDDRKSLPKKSSAYLLNAVINKVADLMDNYPEATILPRESSDEETASILSKVIPVILDRNNFVETYYECSLEKTKNGFAVYGVFWNPVKDNIGEVEIKRIDPLSLRWQPGISNIQESREIFILSDIDNDVLESLYPELRGSFGSVDSRQDHYDGDDHIDRSKKSTVYDWYYKKTVAKEIGGQVFPQIVLHYCKFCNGHVLYASENDPSMQDGWYDDGEYPVVFDVMYPVKDTPYGFGLIDMIRQPQEFIDRMDFALMQNILANARPRFLVKNGSNIDEKEYADFTKMFIHYAGNPDDIKPVTATGVPSIYAQLYADKKEELKENAGNRDFSQGTTSGGVTAASAIAALQEASSKTSRTQNQLSYEHFKDIIRMVIERMQQFYTVPRTFRITSENGQQLSTVYQTISTSQDPNNPDVQTLVPGSVVNESLGTAMGGRKPVYDITIGAEKASPYSKIANNEFAKELYQMGAFNPTLADQVLPAIKLMDFDGKEDVIQTISKNQQLYLQNQQLTQLAGGMAQMIAENTGNTQLLDVMSQYGYQPEIVKETGNSNPTQVNQLGEADIGDDNSQAAQMRRRVSNQASVGGGQ